MKPESTSDWRLLELQRLARIGQVARARLPQGSAPAAPVTDAAADKLVFS